MTPDDARSLRSAVREPSAQMRQAAAAVHELYTALVNEGFDEIQALKIVGNMLSNNQQKG